MAKTLYLLDGMALVYRAHFALINRPIYTSQGVNTSAIHGFTQSLLEIINNRKPTHLLVAFDTAAPTQRHEEYAGYKAQREAMPEELSNAIPHVQRMIQAFNIPVLTADGWEADDIIGTLVKTAEQQGFASYMVTPDKDFSQLVTKQTLLYKPARMGDGVEILDLPAILEKWGVERPEQIIDILGLWGDASDNIPGVPGIGEKTAIKLIAQYGTIENLLAHTGELKGKLKENLESHHDQALLSKRLATIQCNAPVPLDLERYALVPHNQEALRSLCIEFELNSIGKRLFGPEFKAGRGFTPAPKPTPTQPTPTPAAATLTTPTSTPTSTPTPAAPAPHLKSLDDTPHQYRIARTGSERTALFNRLMNQPEAAVATQSIGNDPREARLAGIAFCSATHHSDYLPITATNEAAILESVGALLARPGFLLIGHDLKHDLSLLAWRGLHYDGKLFDTALAHGLAEPEMRHNLGYLSQACLGYETVTDRANASPSTTAPASTQDLPGLEPDLPVETLATEASEKADLAWQLRTVLEPRLKEKAQERVFYEIECPLVSVLADIEREGIRLNAGALDEVGKQLGTEIASLEKSIHTLAGHEFNLNSPKQLGEVLFDELHLLEKPRKTRTGQYATSEQVLVQLAAEHEIVRQLLDYRAATKLKSTYVDTLPLALRPGSSRIHTTYQQLATATGRLNSQNPNLQNIPIRTEKGKEIRKAFVPRDQDHLLLSADYSQIELRIIASLTREEAMLQAFRSGADIHTATAARVYDVPPDLVTPAMRGKAKMVNYGIAYGISPFGLAQRLGIPRREAAEIIDQYFARFPGVARYMEDTIRFCRENGYVQTITGRRRYLRDINSSNGTIRSAAERNAINAPIQGTAADMIKIAMTRIHHQLRQRRLKTRMLLQVHDELVFDLYKPEEAIVRPIVEEGMRNAIPMDVPIEVDIGTGTTWLEAH